VEDRFDRDLESMRMFRHPIPRRRRPGGAAPGAALRRFSSKGRAVAALILLVGVVGGAFLMAPAPPGLRIHDAEAPDALPDAIVDRLPAGTPMFVSVDIPREGYPGLLVLGPDRGSGWLYPKHRKGETFLKVQAGPKIYFRRQGFMLRRPGSWLFIHVLCDQPILPDVQQEILDGLRSRFYWHRSPAEAALPLKHLLETVFSHVIVHRFVSLPHESQR